MSSINGAIKSLMFMPVFPEGYSDELALDDMDDMVDDRLFTVVIKDMISLKEEMISVVDAVELLD